MYLEVKVIIRRPSFTNKMACDEKKYLSQTRGFFYGCKHGRIQKCVQVQRNRLKIKTLGAPELKRNVQKGESVNGH